MRGGEQMNHNEEHEHNHEEMEEVIISFTDEMMWSINMLLLRNYQ